MDRHREDGHTHGAWRDTGRVERHREGGETQGGWRDIGAGVVWEGCICFANESAVLMFAVCWQHSLWSITVTILA